MNEHIRKGNEALAKHEFETARAEFTFALSAPDSVTQRIAKNRLHDLADKITAGDEPEFLRIQGWEERIARRRNLDAAVAELSSSRAETEDSSQRTAPYANGVVTLTHPIFP